MAKPTNTPNPSARHTPGPWRVGEVRHGGRYQLVMHDGRSGYVCEVQAPFHSSGEIDEELREERARLIAAAPDLLEELKHCGMALEKVANLIRPNFSHGAALLDVAVKRVSDVVDKAEGR